MNNTKEACRDYELMLLNAARYSGNKKKEQKIFSASMVGNDLLQNYYKYMYGSSDQQKFGANTFGSIYQLGVDKAIEDSELFSERYTSAFRHQVTLSNGWIISGEMDQIDNKLKVIFDNKVTTGSKIKTLKKEGKHSQYALQMATYQYLLYDYQKNILNIEEPDVYSAVLAIIDKKHTLFTKKVEFEQLTFMEMDTFEIDEMKTILLDKTNELQQYIDLGQEPAQCDNLFFFGQTGSRKPYRCLHFCDFSSNCKYFDKSGKMKMNTLMGL
jgi:hypothetical protein